MLADIDRFWLPRRNSLFDTAPLNGSQWLICLLPMLPMIPVAIFANFLDSSQS